MKTTWQGLPKHPRAVFRKMKIEQEKGEIMGTLPWARFNFLTIWKHIGWLREQILPAGRSFAHALWKPAMTDHVLVFDFLPVPNPGSPEPEQNNQLNANT